MHYQYITTNDALRSVCESASTKAAVALDTEFVRTKTLTPHLGLVQLYDGNQLALIDPRAVTDLTPLQALLENPSVIKVLHACSEDLEAFRSGLGTIPSPVFDTQFAAGLLDLGPSLGYARLVELLCDTVLDKGESRTDWLARPLSEQQLNYAANDVLYLLPAYEKLARDIDDVGKRDWVYQEVAFLAEKKQAVIPYDKAYLQIKNNWRLSPRQLTVLQALAGWRLKVAQQKDLALNFVFKEGHLFDIAQQLPASKMALAGLHGVNPHALRRYGETLLDLVAEALEAFDAQSEAERLPRVLRLIDVPEYKKTLAALKALASELADQHNVAIEMMASKKQLNQLLKWYWFKQDETRAIGLRPDVLSGWRRALFEPGVVAILGQPDE
ncbi:ribonuclease D [Alteromonas sp. CYL-A6]|uniref:ribonuclease D n=1 Tax=Alteromonas nitratireducens TaxID=3390813 RepID=UPI0034B315BE